MAQICTYYKFVFESSPFFFRCIDGINTYTCKCLAGFTGSTCQVNINDCKNDSCVYGICTDMVSNL